MNTLEQSNRLVGTGSGNVAGMPATQTWTPAAANRERPSFWHELFGVAADRSTWGAFLYMLISLATGIAFFTIVATGLSLTAGLMVLIVGIPLLALFVATVRALSFLEGRLVEGLLGTKIPARPWSDAGDLNLLERVWFWLKDRRTWTTTVYLLAQLPLGIAYFTVAVAGLAGGAWLIVVPFMQWIGGHTYISYGAGVTEFLFPTWTLPLLFIAGVVVIVGWMHLVRAIGRGHGAWAKAMLTSSSS